MTRFSPATERLIQELLGKGVLAEEDLAKLPESDDEDDRSVRCYLFGYIDAQTEGEPTLTREQADLYISQLQLTAEEMDQVRTDFRKEQKRKRSLN